MSGTLPMHAPAVVEGWDEPPGGAVDPVALAVPQIARTLVAYFLLATFVISAPVGTGLVAYGIPAGWSVLGLTGSSLVAALLLGQE